MFELATLLEMASLVMAGVQGGMKIAFKKRQITMRSVERT
jgi:hypothetical protein